MTTSSSYIAAAPTDLDYDVLELVCRLRVVTQTQLERLHPDVPARTLRYRTRRLHEHGLLGRSRPYRERGSAPPHQWPTRRGDALLRGAPPPRRGEREAPSPLFLAHAAALSELFVTLRTGGAGPEAALAEFRREGEAREEFAAADGRRRAIAPDVLIGLRYDDGAIVRANVEMDLGTMSRARLRAKLDGYLAHARHLAASGVHGEPPPLLLLTTHARRAQTFLTAARGALARQEGAAGLAIAACDRARHLDEAVAAPCWRTAGDGGDPARLAALLRAR